MPSTKKILASACLSVSVLGASNVHAQTQVGPVAITQFGSGWDSDSFNIHTAEPVANPAGCSTTLAYMADTAYPGYKTYLATALTALSNRQKITIIVSNTQCVNGWPKIIGININP